MDSVHAAQTEYNCSTVDWINYSVQSLTDARGDEKRRKKKRRKKKRKKKEQPVKKRIHKRRYKGLG